RLAQLGEVADEVFWDRYVAGQHVIGMFPPREEMKPEIQRCESCRHPGFRLGRFAYFVEVALLTLRCAFEEHQLPSLNRIQRAGTDFAGFLGELSAKFAVFADMQVIQRSGSQRGADPNA